MAEPNPTGNLWNGRNIIFVLLSADRTNDFRPYQRYEKSNVYFQWKASEKPQSILEFGYE